MTESSSVFQRLSTQVLSSTLGRFAQPLVPFGTAVPFGSWTASQARFYIFPRYCGLWQSLWLSGSPSIFPLCRPASGAGVSPRAGGLRAARRSGARDVA